MFNGLEIAFPLIDFHSLQLLIAKMIFYNFFCVCSHFGFFYIFVLEPWNWLFIAKAKGKYERKCVLFSFFFFQISPNRFWIMNFFIFSFFFTFSVTTFNVSKLKSHYWREKHSSIFFMQSRNYTIVKVYTIEEL